MRGSREPSRYRGHEEIGAMLAELAPFERTLHAVLGQEVWFGGGAAVSHGEAAEARGEVAMCAHHVRRLGEGRDGEDFVIFGRYFDRFAPGEDGRWRFAARRLEVGWTELRPVRLPG